MKPKKFFGQNFLNSSVVIEDIVQSVDNIKDSNVLEIGPGTGNLTKAILTRQPKKMYAVEIDRDLTEYHKQILDEHYNYQLIFDNALTIKEEELLAKPITVIANLPYNIATELLCKWLDKISLFNSLTLMFQKELAQRIAANHGNKKYGRLSVIAGLLCSVRYLFDVPKELFFPIPKVDSAVIQLIPYNKPLFAVDINSLKEVLHILFCHRRKMISTILRDKLYNIEEIKGIDMNLRPEQLSIKQLCELTNQLRK